MKIRGTHLFKQGVLKTTGMLIISFCWLMFFGGAAIGQNTETLKKFFEGKMVELKIDMPATKEGVSIFPRREQPVDYSEYGDRLKEFGTAIYAGESIMVTKVHPKKKHIEFQLGGGGYGTFWDESDYVNVSYAEKTEREKNLEKAIKKEKDSQIKQEMEEELDDLRKDRERENARLELHAQEAQAQKRAQLREKALDAGSRFNIRYDKKVGAKEKTPADLMDALADYVYFPPETFGDNPSVDISEEDDITDNASQSIQKGMSWEAVTELYGMPKSLNENEIAGTKVTDCIFEKDDQVITVKFVEGIVAKYSISSK